MSYSKRKNREAKRRTHLYNASLTRQPTLESFGFHISDKIAESPAHAKHASDTLDSRIPICYPFVKWAGGKTQLLSQLSALAPARFDRYFEPFVGGGALFFYLASHKDKRRYGDQFTAYISDINVDLINAYIAIKEGVEELISLLLDCQVQYNKDPIQYYSKLKDDYNNNSNSNTISRAAQFIALNKTGFNGLYRVNMKGKFNVPIGDYKNPKICNSDNLRNVSDALRRPDISIKACDYKEILNNAKEGDFVYFDPPYIPINDTAYFTLYTARGFSYKDQIDLANVFKLLDKRGCKVMLTNADTPQTWDLYSFPTANITVVNANRAINSNAEKRKGHTELVIRNYIQNLL